ncbi:hypothetical protein H2201_006955 [Coniosporium apollinis]|uniref:CHCH domain-containing protein n=2 Tax=Coniosporium TaxID=2810619 RepID=A0ABQ9NMW1_9PEZI|nr:hypothetical protein H2199_005328 [Cladosporium sp. JES 115]KAJ9660374.1 hypothetical protein H2201_006955 [Coniosporium apollinis]
MPRQSRGSAPPRRPVAAPSRPNVTPPQQPQARPATTAARPPAQAQAPHPPAQAQGQSPGLFGQMASTAAGVAVGSSIGHAIGGFFGGGSSAPAEAQQANASATSDNSYNEPARCATDVNNFKNCMNENQGDLTICGWYLDQLKACQAAARGY